MTFLDVVVLVALTTLLVVGVSVAVLAAVLLMRDLWRIGR